MNLSSVFRLCRAAGRHMLDRGAGGKIVNVASLLSFQGGITVPGYAAAKGGVVQLTKALANEWASHGINVNAIAPGYMETDNTTRAARGPAAQPADHRTHPGRTLGHARKIWPAPSCSWPRAPPTTCTVTCSSSTAAGWAADGPHRRTALVVGATCTRAARRLLRSWSARRR